MACGCTNSRLLCFVSILLALTVALLHHVSQIRFSFCTHSEPNHLIVIQHGLNYPSFVNYPTYYLLSNRLIEHKRNGDEYMIYLAHSNSEPHLFSFLYHTNNGIVHASSNLANEIYDVVRNHTSIRKISLVGCSIGGNFIRYTSHMLQTNESYSIDGFPFFQVVEPVNLITLAAPHLGVGDWFQLPQQAMQLIHDYCPSQTFREMLYMDSDGIVAQMNNDEAIFSLFKNVLIFYNSGWDSLVTCESSAIDKDGTLCQRTQDYCNEYSSKVLDLDKRDISENQTLQRIPICLRRNVLESIMAHAIVSLSLPPIVNNMVELLT